MTIPLTPETERLLNNEVMRGHCKDADDVMQCAQRALTQQDAATQPNTLLTSQEAAAHIRALRKGVTLGGLKIQDLMHEGHKY